jgi:hypothetical protein
MESPPTDNPSRLCNRFVQSGAAGETKYDSPPLPATLDGFFSMTERRFPPPWSVEEQEACFNIRSSKANLR